MEYRFMHDEDKEAVKKLWKYCFDDPENFVDWYFQEYYSGKNTIGIFQDKNLHSCLQLIPYDIYLRGQILSSAYIVGIASSPEARGGGLIKKLLKASLAEMKKRNQIISLLMPFEAQFYYPYQWNFCYHHYLYKMSLDDLQGISETYGKFTVIDNLDEWKVKDLDFVYTSFMQNKHGFVKRDYKNWYLIWRELQIEKGFAYLLENDGVPEGYIFYYLQNNKIVVKEMAYTNFRAQKSLFRFLYNHRSQVELFEWHAPLDDSTHHFLPDPKKGISLYPFLTARIVDVQKVLTSISYPQEIAGEIIIDLIDPLAAWNNQIFYLNVQNKNAQVYTTDKEPQVTLDIGTLTQLVFGTLRAKELAYMGKIDNNPEIIKFLDQLFPLCNNYINEYY